MKLATLDPDGVSEGNHAVIRVKEEANDDCIYVGEVVGRDGVFLTTSIPLNAKETRYDVIGIEGDDGRNIPEEAERWIGKYEKSMYRLYMRIQVNNSGDISVSGV